VARKSIPAAVRQQVLIEAGYRCAVPTCRNLLVLDLHHILPVSEGGPNEVSNLIASCPTCHSLYERGHMPTDAIRAYKATLEVLNHAFDLDSLDLLIFLDRGGPIGVDGSGALRFARLIANGLATNSLLMQNGPLLLYTVKITPKGKRLLDAWRTADQETLASVMSTQS
jgi:hypothetical protein